jgi:two-component system, OmpR family, sensor histidine kinase KdpD
LQRQFLRLWVSISLVMVATLAAMAIEKVGTTDIVMLYLLSVICTSYFLGFPAAILAAVGSFLAINFFFIEPRYTFEVANSESWAALLGFLVVSFVVASLVKRLQSQTRKAEEARMRAESSRELAEQLAVLHTENEVFATGCRLIQNAMSLPIGIAVPDSRGEGFVLICQVPTGEVLLDQRAAKWCCQNGKAIGPGTNNWPENKIWLMPFGRLPGTYPVLVVMKGTSEADESEVTFLRGLLDQLATAYQRVRNEQRAKDAEYRAQEESIQSTLLASMSHDMRTPLTSILGATTTLLSHHAALDDAEQVQLLESVNAEARHLAKTTENILSLTRLESRGNLDNALDWQSPEEIVGAVLRRYRTRNLPHQLRSRVPRNVPLIRADAALLTQALGNLIDNALVAHHGGEPIWVGVQLQDNGIALSVEDRGHGFPDSFRAEDIRKFQRMDPRSKGMGLGLAIVQAIARLHKAQLQILRREGGGASVSLIFPTMAGVENLE